MKNTFGNCISITIFGESHGPAIGAVIDGMPGGIPIDEEFIEKQLALRSSLAEVSTGRRERDKFSLVSGIFNGLTTGTAITIVIPNENINSDGYEKNRDIPRPGHGDFSANCKYQGFEDYRGGGHLSGRVTAAVVAAGAIAISALNAKNIEIGTHILKCGSKSDRSFNDYGEDIRVLNTSSFAVLDREVKEKMIAEIIQAKESGDSVGGVLETAVVGVPAGIGEPFWDSLEGMISHGIFAIPGVKGIEFGDGFKLAEMFGSEANDPFTVEDGKIVTSKNSNGGINGGISNGMPVIFRTAVKPTPSIFTEQDSVSMKTLENCKLRIEGRHDPCIVHRARVVVDSVTALVMCDMLACHLGPQYLQGGTNE